MGEKGKLWLKETVRNKWRDKQDVTDLQLTSQREKKQLTDLWMAEILLKHILKSLGLSECCFSEVTPLLFWKSCLHVNDVL